MLYYNILWRQRTLGSISKNTHASRRDPQFFHAPADVSGGPDRIPSRPAHKADPVPAPLRKAWLPELASSSSSCRPSYSSRCQRGMAGGRPAWIASFRLPTLSPGSSRSSRTTSPVRPRTTISERPSASAMGARARGPASPRGPRAPRGPAGPAGRPAGPSGPRLRCRRLSSHGSFPRRRVRPRCPISGGLPS